MSGKLDQPLDEIVSAQRRTVARRRNPRRSSARPATVAPIGGIQKAGRNARGAAVKPTAAKGAGGHGESKVIVSNLPRDVSEMQIKEYFVQSVGPIKRVELVYGPNSQSRGIANVTFHKLDGASRAFQTLNGLLVDKRPIKIEIVVGAAQADKVIPQVRSLADRMTQPKAQPKSAAGNKQKTMAGKAGVTKSGPKGKRTAKNVRPSKKTAEELDSEMADYFVSNDNAGTSAAPAAAAPAVAASGDASMDDEIM